MTPAVLDRPMLMPGHAPLGGRVTLEERLNSVLHEARANGSTDCPLCHARMAPALAGTQAGAECRGCGTRLS